MRPGSRVAMTLAALASASAAIWILLTISSHTDGPLAMTLDRIGGAVDTLEHYARERLAGPGRRSRLRWLDDYRSDAGRLRRPDRVLLGAFVGGRAEAFDRVAELERALDVTLPLVHVYTAWGDQPEHQFPHRAATAIWNMGSVPLITWEPWLATFDNVRHPFLPLREARDLHGLAAVAKGDYDFYVDRWAADAAAFGRPLFVRFAHEMNDPYRYPWGPQHNTKEEFIAAWRHVVERFRQAGAANVVWVWSPHVAHQYWDLYYPGGEWVDWVATGVLNFGPVAQWSEWWTLDEIFGSKYDRLAAFGKPIMIAEFGSLAVGGDRIEWYRQALTSLRSRYPGVRSLVFFHTSADRTVTYQQVDWTITNDAALAQAIADALRPFAEE